MDTSGLTMYGSKLKPDELKSFLEHIFTENDKREGPGTPVCIWGTHGLGKTHIAKAFANDRNWKCVDVPVAQFEEMGELHGMPAISDPTPDEYGNPNFSGDEKTVYLPPEWVPKKHEVGPGILLLDDFNRADDRILRGVMQLLQNFELISWELPPKWQIVATANPEGGDYSVTPFDDAMLTRMIHTTLTFDSKDWARWADSAGVDKRGISFVLNHPEAVTFKRTTPRTLEQFFRQIEGIEDLEKEKVLVRRLGAGTLDDVTIGSFMSFVRDDLTELIDPEDILEAQDFKVIDERLEKVGKDKDGNARLDRISTICTRLFIHVSRKEYSPGSRDQENLCAFLKSNRIPKDLKVGMAMDLSNEASDQIREMLRSDPKVAKLLLGSM
jgi:hypothetical protein